ncbi:hypothetical protein BT69DRAFT_1331576 [Atractiella rhizophila]|nr:hypothetical protein BT69DRAFT_1331576 [Atractiella rhizophila]
MTKETHQKYRLSNRFTFSGLPISSSNSPIDPVLLSWYGVEREGDEEVDPDEEWESVIGDDEAEEKEEYSEEEDMWDWMLEDEVLPGSVYDAWMKEKDKEQWEVGEGWLKRARTAGIGYSKLEHKQGRATKWRHEEEQKKRV